MASFDCESYCVLVGLADYFKKAQPPCIRESIHCLQSALYLDLPDLLKAQIRLDIALILLEHTNNVGHARSHLQEALQISQLLVPEEGEEIMLRSSSILAQISAEYNNSTISKNILRSALERSATSRYVMWHYQLIFQLANVHAADNEHTVATELLTYVGEASAEQRGHAYVRVLFGLSNCLILLAKRDFTQFEEAVLRVTRVLGTFTAQTVNQQEAVKTFFSLIKTYFCVLVGKVKSGKPDLKALQQSIQVLTATQEDRYSTTEAENFYWMSKDLLCVLVYLVTVMHSMISGYMEKAIKYTEKALTQVERMKGAGQDGELLQCFQFSLIEHLIMCRIVQGQGFSAIQEIRKARALVQRDGSMWTLSKPVIHFLLGLYAMSMNLMDDAIAHFQRTLSLSPSNLEMHALASLNLAIIFARAGEARQFELLELFRHLNNPTVARSHALQSCYFYVKGLKAFFDSAFNDAKKFLREALRLANSEDLNRLTACSLILLGHVMTSVNIPQEAISMVLPAMQLSSKIPDLYLQLWAASVLKDTHRMMGDDNRVMESAQLHHFYTTQLLQDHFAAGQCAEHAMLKETH